MVARTGHPRHSLSDRPAVAGPTRPIAPIGPRGTMSSVIGTRPLAESLASTPFFSGLDPASLERVRQGMRTRRFRRGEVIFHMGDPGDALFIVMSGAVKIMCSRAENPSGRATEYPMAAIPAAAAAGHTRWSAARSRSVCETRMQTNGSAGTR